MRQIAAAVLVLGALAGCGGSSAATPPATPAPAQPLRDLVTATVTRCRFDSMQGTVLNGATDTVDVTLALQWLDGKSLTDSGLQTVVGLKPGQTATWNASRPSTGRATDCTADVRSAVIP